MGGEQNSKLFPSLTDIKCLTGGELDAGAQIPMAYAREVYCFS